MVGTENNVSNFYNVAFGKVVRSFGKTKPENVSVTERVNKNGDTVYEQRYDFIDGEIKKAILEENEDYGDSIKLIISDGFEEAQLQIKFDSAYGRSFLFKIPNFKFNDKIKIKPYAFVSKDDGRNISGLNIFVGGKKIPNKYTKDTPNGLPKLKKVVFNGKDQWDKTEQIAFLKNKFNEFCANFENVVSENVSSNVDDVDF